MAMRNRTTATSLALLLLCLMGLAQAAPVGQVSNLSGPLFAIALDGTKRVLSVGSEVEPGETLITEAKTYAQVRFIDKGVVTLKPDTHFRIDAFGFAEQAPERDSAVFGLLKGALRTITGLIGKRGRQEAYRMNTATATIGIRGTSFGVTLCPSPACGDLPAGTYVDIFDGQIALSQAPVPGQPEPPPPLILSAGQFGFVPPDGPPQQLPGDPGLARTFTPPPSFQSTEQEGADQQTSPVSRPGMDEDGCIVR